MIIAFLNQKGGTGKTMLALHVAAALSRRSNRVLLIDADPQASALTWADVREAAPLFSVIGKPSDKLHREIEELGEGYDMVVIDGAPRSTGMTRSAIAASDLVVVPVQPSGVDIWAAQEIVDLTNEAATFKETLKTTFVVNRKIPNTVIGRSVGNALAQFEIPIMQTEVSQRVGFAETVSIGITVIEDGRPAYDDARDEIIALTSELIGFAQEGARG